jgi:hypothetical protein
MDNSAVNQLVKDVSRDLVTEIAPQELPLFRASSEVFFQNPDELLSGRKSKDDMLGFGTGDAVVLMTPVIMAVSQQVILFVVEQVKKSAQEESSTLIDETVKKMFKKFRSKEQMKPAALTAEQLAQVRKAALKKARELKLSEERAKLLADAVVGTLAVS